MMAAAVFDVAASNPGPSLWDDVAWPCCPDDGIAAVAVSPDCFACLNRSAQTTNCVRDRVANDQSIPSGEYYGAVTLLAFHRLLVAVGARNCNSSKKKKYFQETLNFVSNIVSQTYLTLGTDFKSSGAFGPSRRFCIANWAVLHES